MPYFIHPGYILPFRMTWISTLKQRNRRCQRSAAQILIIRPSLMPFLLSNLMKKVSYQKRIHIHCSTKCIILLKLRNFSALKVDTWLLRETSLSERCWWLRSQSAASLLPRSLVRASFIFSDCLLLLLFYIILVNICRMI